MGIPYRTLPTTCSPSTTAFYLRDAIREDLMNLAMVQSNLFSGAKQYQFLGNMEPMVGHSYQAVADQVGHG